MYHIFNNVNFLKQIILTSQLKMVHLSQLYKLEILWKTPKFNKTLENSNSKIFIFLFFECKNSKIVKQQNKINITRQKIGNRKQQQKMEQHTNIEKQTEHNTTKHKQKIDRNTKTKT